jgi:hypothetical protein
VKAFSQVSLIVKVGLAPRARALVVALLVVLSLLLLWPLVWHPTTRVPLGDGSGDSFQFMWNLWWTAGALRGEHALWHTQSLYWPETSPLVFHTLSPALGAISAPIQWLVRGTAGLALSLNVLTVASFVAAGLAARRITLDLGGTALGAFAAAALAVASPYRLWHLNHVNLLALPLGLWTLAALHRAMERGGRWVPATALLGAIVTFSDFETAIATALLALLLVVARVRSPAGRRRLLATIALAAALHLPLVIALWDFGVWPALPASEQAEYLSANLVALVSPDPSSLLHGPWAPRPGAHGVWGGEVTQGPLLVALLVVLLGRRGAPSTARWVAAVAGLFLLLSLGPTLHVGDLDLLKGKMPPGWLRAIAPPLALSRSPVRMAGVASLLLPIALGLALPQRTGLSALLIALALCERLPNHAPGTEAVFVPDAYRRGLPPGPVLALPDSYVARQLHMFWQTVHHQPITTGWIARVPPGGGSWLAATLRAPPVQFRDRVRTAHIRTIAVHPDQPADLLRREPKLTILPVE